MDEEIPMDAPLYRCVPKKFVSVGLKVALAASILAIVAGGIYIIEVIGPFLVSKIGSDIDPILSEILSVIFSLPVWADVIVLIILAVFTYSFIWCVWRRFTKEDRDAPLYGIIGAVLGVLAWIAILGIGKMVSGGNDFMFVGFFYFGGMLSIPVGYFIGIYATYLKRIAGEQKSKKESEVK